MAASLFLAIGLITAAEGLARWACRFADPVWAYWQPEVGANFEHFRRLIRDGYAPEVLVVGDSTAQTNFDADVLGALWPHAGASWNLGCPGNLPEAFRVTTLPLLAELPASPRVMILSLIPTGFVESETARNLEHRILSSALCRRTRGAWDWGDYLHLARVWSSLRVWKSTMEGATSEMIAQRGFRMRETTWMGDHDSDCKYPDAGPVLSAHRVAVLEELADWCAERGTLLVVVVPPTLDGSECRGNIERSYRAVLHSGESRGRYLVFDPAREQPFEARQFADPNHLNARGAAMLTQVLARRVAPRLVPPRGKS